MSDLSALRELQEQAGHAGDWTLDDYVDHIDIRSALEGIAVEVPGIEEQDRAIAKLVVVSKNHLLPLAEALAEGPCGGTHDWPNCKLHDNCTSICSRCCALKALQEALDVS